MRIVSFSSGGRMSWGAVVNGGIVDLAARLSAFPTVRALLEADALDKAHAALEGATPDLALDAVTLLPPVTDPEKILCIGVNYANRNAEYKDGAEEKSYPSMFVRFPNSFVGHGTPIERPPVSDQLDYEGEIVLVIGRAGRRIPADRALSHVAGATLANEGTIRDWTRHAKFNVTQGKNFDRTGAIGPWMVTSDAIDLAAPLHLTTTVNGELRQDDTTANMMYSFARLIEYITTFATLKPGDMILTGTPTGAGARFDPPRWLTPGDVVAVAVPEIGTLSNSVIDEPR
ncbi:fumarylacetoacetate hydrolase family protein [Microbaculum marinisediminis]|uniref:Fumarylacetoacetate hydrolase family protein n=1 Tax=Microbaculum marinisediminis TaxID=2931392 RepID=A0AAW5QZM8_9HYPH|nr:fumarylacetoacetate hydrolase family protein [Microbaculum sp. A6E488]MCT8972083.1 fumarylacetoacetate hydrolase family protein [Microbaculum sp. A6E488]